MALKLLIFNAFFGIKLQKVKPEMKRTAFFVSDSTGITAENLGNSLLSQFEEIQFEKFTESYVDTIEKAENLISRIDAAAERDGLPPIVFDTVVNKDIRQLIEESSGYTIDVFGAFLDPLEKELHSRSSRSVGKSHAISTNSGYQSRIEAVHYALDSDDGAKLNHYERADIILIGVSRSGKTPTCLYMALQYGIFAANYPLTEEDMDSGQLPKALKAHRDKLFGLTINPERLCAIRQERRADSKYASLTQCENEVRDAERLLLRNGILHVDTTHFSIEEITAKIMSKAGIARKN
jgi:regulator of PEP synthase PpsR (kinase-PPPase family)